MTELQQAAQQALDEWRTDPGSVRMASLMMNLGNALAEPLTDEDISVLWHQSGEQPFKFARMLLK
jgi:hypothetical protein